VPTTQKLDDYYVGIPLNIEVLYARQDAENTEHHTLPEIMTWAKERGVLRQIGNPTSLDIQMPQIKRKGKKTTTQRMEVPMHTFKKDNGNALVPVGGHFGILKQAIHRIGKAKKGNYYRGEQWDLISVFSADKSEYAKVPIGKDGMVSIEVKLGKINRSGQDAAYVQFAWERLDRIVIGAILRVNRTCPLTLEEIKDTLHGLQDIPFGPNKHGVVDVDDDEVKEFASFDEAVKHVKKLEKGLESSGKIAIRK